MQRNPKYKTRRPAIVRAGLLESLENRQLMADFSASFDFKPSWAATAPGYLADVGKSFSQQGSYQFGWSTDNSANVMDRFTAGEDRLDTYALIGQWAAQTWEVAVPNGDYRVNLTAGDFATVSARYVLKVENSIIIDESPTTNSRFSEGTGVVTVTDGRLTLSSAGGYNNKVCSISIQGVGSTGNTGNGAGIAVPAAPSWAGAWSVSDSSLTLGWGDASTNESGFIIEQSTNNTSFSEVARVGANTTTRNITGLTAGTNYYYRVKAFNGAGTTTAAATTVRTTGTVTPTTAAPTRPSWIWASTASSNSIAVLWGDNSWNESGFIVQRSSDNSSFSEVARVGANVANYTDTGLSANTTYYYKVASYNAGGSAATTYSYSARTSPSTPVATLPANPSWISSFGVSSSAGTVNWGDASNNETGFIIQRSTDGTSFSEAGRVGANTTTFNASGLNASTRYYFRVLAYNNAGQSAATAPTNFVTAAIVTPVSTPSAPSSLWGWTTGNNSATLQWSNVANENGYRVERSTDGANFSSVGTVGTDTTTYNVTGLTAGTNYTFRVIAYNNGGDSAATARTTLTTSGSNNNNNNNNNNNTINRAALSGIVQNEVAANVAIPALRELGMTSVRLWYSLRDWNSGPYMADINRAKTYKDAGFNVTVAIVAKEQTDYNTARSYFNRMAADPTCRYAIDYWEIGNEPNLYAFWNGSLQSFVSNYQKPAYEALHAYGETVVGGGVSWDVSAVQTLVAAGYNNYCDYANFHPYGESGAIVIQRARDAKAAFGNKPMIVSEWNVQGISDATTMAREVNIAAIGLSNIATMNYYFALAVGNSHVGQGGVIYTNGSKNYTFWNTVYSWTH